MCRYPPRERKLKQHVSWAKEFLPQEVGFTIKHPNRTHDTMSCSRKSLQECHGLIVVPGLVQKLVFQVNNRIGRENGTVEAFRLELILNGQPLQPSTLQSHLFGLSPSAGTDHSLFDVVSSGSYKKGDSKLLKELSASRRMGGQTKLGRGFCATHGAESTPPGPRRQVLKDCPDLTKFSEAEKREFWESSDPRELKRVGDRLLAESLPIIESTRPREEISEEAFQAREELGWSLKQVSESLGITEELLEAWEDDRVKAPECLPLVVRRLKVLSQEG